MDGFIKDLSGFPEIKNFAFCLGRHVPPPQSTIGASPTSASNPAISSVRRNFPEAQTRVAGEYFYSYSNSLTTHIEDGVQDARKTRIFHHVFPIICQKPTAKPEAFPG
eukprot:Blabericola_migrator_1__4314@NODE_2324_length_2937_cov_215_669686_g1457_i0_p5_GENE_NODE_2324_length_2937_cov_215_669686_g1457_i0NODE_2324_length_2937_cov_215_669686_g1457_i0_p5_ORF_typecomplete_len108_score12_74_NODE_2324_length_2937_cov_215_669686_g1457_i017522075